MKVKLDNYERMQHGKDTSFLWSIIAKDNGQRIGDIVIIEVDNEFYPWYTCRDDSKSQEVQTMQTYSVNDQPFKWDRIEYAFMNIVGKVRSALGLEITKVDPDEDRKITLDKLNDHFFNIFEEA